MFRLIRFAFSLLILGAIWYAATSLDLGGKTLWGHLKAIAGSDESKALVKEVKKKAVQVKEKGLKGESSARKAPKKEKAKVKVKVKVKPKEEDSFTPEEREALRKVINKKLEATPEKAP